MRWGKGLKAGWQGSLRSAVASLLVLFTAAILPGAAIADATSNDAASDCFNENSARRIPGCTALLDGSANPGESGLSPGGDSLEEMLARMEAQELAGGT